MEHAENAPHRYTNPKIVFLILFIATIVEVGAPPAEPAREATPAPSAPAHTAPDPRPAHHARRKR